MINRLIVISLLFLLIILTACQSKPTLINKPNNKELLIQALRANDFNTANMLIPKLELTENAQNLIHLYVLLRKETLLKLEHEVDYLAQFYLEMNFMHKSMFIQMRNWIDLKQVYRKEISPPIRILQRHELLLAPSEINFESCASENNNCARHQRKRLLTNITAKQINAALKRMALKDPCVNLSFKPQSGEKANRCLMKSSGDLKIELLPLPKFSHNEWLQAISQSR